MSCKYVIKRAAVFSGIAVLTATAFVPAQALVLDRPFFRAASIVIVIGATEDEANGGIAPIAFDFNLLTPSSSGSAAPDLIEADGFVFNSRNGFAAGHDFSGGATELELIDETSGGNFGNGGDAAYLEAADSLTSFGLDETTGINVRRARNVSRFLVVSNAAFDLYSEASNLTTTGDFNALDYENIGFRAVINRSGGTGTGAWGTQAQNPSIGGGGIDTDLNDLGDMSSGPTKFFDGGRRTARFPGTLLEQAISFNIRYALNSSANASATNQYDFSMGVGTIGADVTYTIYTP